MFSPLLNFTSIQPIRALAKIPLPLESGICTQSNYYGTALFNFSSNIHIDGLRLSSASLHISTLFDFSRPVSPV